MKNLRLRIILRGAVQGVGFRPFVYRLATELKVTGWVQNSSYGVIVEIEAQKDILDIFLLRIEKEKPIASFIQSFESSFLDPLGFQDFQIKESISGEKTALILPDIATCPECRKEILDPENRRYQYPFTNCTLCGPRYSIVENLPYDRANTTMKRFRMCPECQKEYDDPKNRRFHAQPNACSKCGPYLEFWDNRGKIIQMQREALLKAVQMIKDGNVVAIKGLGGFHLVVDAQNKEAVSKLRDRKQRGLKPFAVMYSCLDEIQNDCEVSDLEKRSLLSSEAPIVLLKKKKNLKVADNIAPQNPYLGVILACTPLHILILDMLRSPIVATSGNLSEETICINNGDALNSLKHIADGFLMHNRKIVHHADDSIVRIMAGREMVLRRARGFAPLPVFIKNIKDSILAVGPHLKNTVAFSKKENVFVSQHIGDLEAPKAFETFEKTIQDLTKIYNVSPSLIVCDEHSGYLSTQFAEQSKLPKKSIQHHYAHICSCMAENEIEDDVLGVCFDGTGYGQDNTIWGGEFLKVDHGGFKRFAYFSPFPLLGGEKAMTEPRRSALGLLYHVLGKKAFDEKETESLKAFKPNELIDLELMLEKKINSPLTSSVGRIFDAVSSLLGFCQYIDFEGQAAMDVEFAISDKETDSGYSFDVKRDKSLIIEELFVEDILKDIKFGVESSIICRKFHNTLVDIIIAIAMQSGLKKVVLTGGCFQNKYLLERSIDRLREEGFLPYWHQRIPTNDGGISLGQIVAASKENMI
ncbi:MAG: carbamoyltransferase HypF [Candidatus Omnitrophica bacterium]|nr:carbamoyltransferase HypF [Candidatus Omnitrophota bacterium]